MTWNRLIGALAVIACSWLAASAVQAQHAARCENHRDCSSCLADTGCNWTAGECLGTCYEDTWCYGPGNPYAATCPVLPDITGTWDEDVARRSGEERVFVPSATGSSSDAVRWTLRRGGVLLVHLRDERGPYVARGTWRQDTEDSLTLEYVTRGGTTQREYFRVLEATREVLRVRPPEPFCP